ncbi:MAG: hypothetical protein PF488_03205 [Patescibacteria group bacterium]|jgi:hypothetical protein|nr:hypothetical protein [Patescibacteria group bacterium]
MKQKLTMTLLVLFIIAGLVFVTTYLIKDSVENINEGENREDLINFETTGNVVKDGSTWSVVYEEPGAPALKEKLVFDEQSVCLKEGVCRPVYWQIGDRVEVVGIKGDEGILVYNFKVVELEKEVEVDMDIETCQERGGVVMYPDCEGCDPYCSFDNKEETNELTPNQEQDRLCVDNCGNGICEEIVCMGEGCPCPETAESCPEDCA